MKRSWGVALLLVCSVLAQTRCTTPDPAWNRLFSRRQGWSGADGAYSVALPGGDLGWLFSDTFVGRVDASGRRDPRSRFLHNSWARTGARGARFAEIALLQARPGHWYWVYAPTLDEDGRGWLFVGEFTSAPGAAGFDFRQTGTALAALDWSGPSPRLGRPVSLPFFTSGAEGVVHYGASAVRDGEFLYVWGTRDRKGVKSARLARVPAQHPQNPSAWRFWTGTAWGERAADAVEFPGETANEFSVYRHPKRGGWRWLDQVGRSIRLRRAPRPEGPWSDPVVVAETPAEQGGAWSYNAKAHPELSDGRGLLITYNSNAFPPQQVMQHADLYRPRCLRLTRDPWDG